MFRHRDAESALQVMEFLHDYAREAKGRRVFLTIHQPSTVLWKQIDHVVLLSKGKLMYQGSRQQMEDFFSSAGCPTPVGWNPADHYVTVSKATNTTTNKTTTSPQVVPFFQ